MIIILTATRGYHNKIILIILVIRAALDVYNSLINQRKLAKHLQYSTIIDEILKNIKSYLLNYASLFMLYKDVLDHLPVCFQLKLKQTKKISKLSYICKLTQERIDYFLADLDNKLYSHEMENNYVLTKLLDTRNCSWNFQSR